MWPVWLSALPYWWAVRTTSPKPQPARRPQANTGGSTEVKGDGSDLSGLNMNSVTCVKQDGKINAASAAINAQAGLAVIVTDEATPALESLSMMVDGNALGVSNMMGAKTVSAEVKVDGSTYTITDEAAGAISASPHPRWISAGVGSVEWSAAPSGIFDAAEDTVSWSIEAVDKVVTAVVRVELSGPGSPNGIAVRLRSGPFGGAGVLRADGRAVLPVVDSHQQPISESAA